MKWKWEVMKKIARIGESMINCIFKNWWIYANAEWTQYNSEFLAL